MLCQEDKILIISYLKKFVILKLSAFDTILFDNGQEMSEFGFARLMDFLDCLSNRIVSKADSFKIINIFK